MVRIIGSFEKLFMHIKAVVLRLDTSSFLEKSLELHAELGSLYKLHHAVLVLYRTLSFQSIVLRSLGSGGCEARRRASWPCRSGSAKLKLHSHLIASYIVTICQQQQQQRILKGRKITTTCYACWVISYVLFLIKRYKHPKWGAVPKSWINL